MSKRILTSVAAAAASLAVAQTAQAGVVDFEDRIFVDPSNLQTEANHFDEQGLHFEGLQFFFIPAGNPDVILPTAYSSTFMETALEPVVISRTGGGVFDFLSIALGLGDFNAGASDNVLVTGTKANCVTDCTVTANLTVTNAFQTFSLAGFAGLSSVSFGMPTSGGDADSGYLAFDNLSTRAPGEVPEPATWAMMLLGFGALGAVMRRRRAALAA